MRTNFDRRTQTALDARTTMRVARIWRHIRIYVGFSNTRGFVCMSHVRAWTTKTLRLDHYKVETQFGGISECEQMQERGEEDTWI